MQTSCTSRPSSPPPKKRKQTHYWSVHQSLSLSMSGRRSLQICRCHRRHSWSTLDLWTKLRPRRRPSELTKKRKNMVTPSGPPASSFTIHRPSSREPHSSTDPRQWSWNKPTNHVRLNLINSRRNSIPTMKVILGLSQLIKVVAMRWMPSVPKRRKYPTMSYTEKYRCNYSLMGILASICSEVWKFCPEAMDTIRMFVFQTRMTAHSTSKRGLRAEAGSSKY